MDELKGQSLSAYQAASVPWRPVGLRELAIILLGLAGCWVGAASVGLLALGLRHALLGLLIGGLVVLAWPGRLAWVISSQEPPLKRVHNIPIPGVPITPQRLAQAAGLLLAVLLFAADSHPVLNLLAVVLTGAGLASLQQHPIRKKLLTSLALAGWILTVHRLALLSIPTYWHVADQLGGFLGRLGGSLAGQPLEVGATFGGIDFLVLSFAWYIIWVVQIGQFGWKTALAGAIAILLAQLVYLAGLSWTPILREKLPPPPPRPEFHVYLPPAWSWSEALKSLLPWSFPWVGMGLHLGVLALAFRWTGWPEASPTFPNPNSWQGSDNPHSPSNGGHAANPGKQILLELGPIVLMLLWGGLSFFWISPPTLGGKRVLAYAPNPQDWLPPSPDQYSRSDLNRFSMLPELVLGLGGRWSFSSQLTEPELQQADLVLLLGDVGVLSASQIAALSNYVDSGGRVLAAFGERSFGTTKEGLPASTLLAQWGMQIQYETAVCAWGQWLEALFPLSHPVASGIAPKAPPGNWLPLSRSATVKPAYGLAYPVLVGQWGYGDPGRHAVHTDFLPQYEAGERLGDVVLAAETWLGSGRVFVLASDEWFRNENLPSCYGFVARLMGYLAHRGARPADLWRQLLGFGAGVLVVLLMAYRPTAPVLAVTAAVLGLILLAGWWQSSQAGRLLPQSPGRLVPPPAAFRPQAASAPTAQLAGSSSEAEGPVLPSPKGLPVAYIDASHMDTYSLHPWHPHGLGRLFFTLIQAGYLPLLAPDMKPDRLQTAAVWLSIAPGRHFSGSEQAALQEYVRNGGIFIAMAGAENAEALRPLLEGWGLRIPRSPVGPANQEPEAEPVGQSPGPGEHPDNYGRLRTYYLNAKDYGRGDYMVAVSLHAPWPVEPIIPDGQFQVGDADVLVRGYNDVPIVIHRQIGGGSVVVIGDTYFAANKNFDEADGQPTEGMIENAHFWRWMLSRVSRQQEWVPPDPAQWLPLLPPEQLWPDEMIPEEPAPPVRPAPAPSPKVP